MLNVRNASPTAVTLHIDEEIGLADIRTLAPGGGVMVSARNDELRRLEDTGHLVITEVDESPAPAPEAPAPEPEPVAEPEPEPTPEPEPEEDKQTENAGD